MPGVILETARLILREYEEVDAPHMFELNSDPEVLKFTGDISFQSVDHALQLITNYHAYKEHGYGRWSCILKETQEYLGWCGLRKDNHGIDTDIGYRFHRRHWGKGYATESAAACVELGFKTFGLPQIIGRAKHEHVASIRVLEKLGLTHSHDGDSQGDWVAIYVKHNPYQ